MGSSSPSRGGARSSTQGAFHAAVLAGAMQHLIDDLPEQVALLSEDFTIIAVNRSWAEAMLTYGYTRLSPGDDYLAVCRQTEATGYEPSTRAIEALEQIASGELASYSMVFNGRGRWSSHEYELCFHRVEVGSQAFITITRFEHTEIIELRRAQDELRKSLIESQEVERQRIARELHDSTAQSLAAIGLLLGQLRRGWHNPDAKELVEEIRDLVSEAQQQIRAVSYLALPPSVEKLGLIKALELLVEGFRRRTALDTSFEIEGERLEIAAPVQAALYRVAQESLSNAHRHAFAAAVRVGLRFRGPFLQLTISDDGVGISGDTLAGRGATGVGIASMKSRLSELGGRLSLRRLSPGTAVIATMIICD